MEIGGLSSDFPIIKTDNVLSIVTDHLSQILEATHNVYSFKIEDFEAIQSLHPLIPIILLYRLVFSQFLKHYITIATTWLLYRNCVASLQIF
jgi:hypothetical protein